MCIEELIIYGKKYIHSHEAKMLLSNILNYDSLELLNHLDEIVSPENEQKYKNLIKGVLEKKPIQYLIGNVNFYGYEFYVNENVLIPRFETEQLVENVILFINKYFAGNIKVIDLGTGSGVIGITLKKKLKNLDVTCLEISSEAIKVAKKNANANSVNINFIEGNMLESVEEKFDIIVSNPPYISKYEPIDDIVKNNEPSIALYGGDDGLDYYRQILSKASKNVNERFLIAFEIGYTQKNDIIELATKYFPNATYECIKDLSNKDRIIFIYSV